MISPAEMDLGQLTWPLASTGVDPSRAIAPETWAILEQALVPPPCAYGRLPWVFLIVRDPQVRARLMSPSAPPAVSSGCSHFVVFARNTSMSEADLVKFLHRTTVGHTAQHGAFRAYSAAKDSSRGESRGISVEEWTARQAYVALDDLMVTARLLGVEACQMDGLEPARYDAVLGLSAKGYSTVCACSLGYWAGEAAGAIPPQIPTFPS